jgi:hypothetical protein
MAKMRGGGSSGHDSEQATDQLDTLLGTTAFRAIAGAVVITVVILEVIPSNDLHTSTVGGRSSGWGAQHRLKSPQNSSVLRTWTLHGEFPRRGGMFRMMSRITAWSFVR